MHASQRRRRGVEIFIELHITVDQEMKRVVIDVWTKQIRHHGVMIDVSHYVPKECAHSALLLLGIGNSSASDEDEGER